MNIQDILSQPDGSLKNIVINLDEVELKEKYDLITKVLAKSALDGTVSIVGIEIYEFAKSVFGSQKTLEEANVILNTVKSMDTLDNIKRFLLKFGFKTISVKREGGYYVCTTRHSN